MADPIRLSDVLAEVSRLYATVKQSLDKKSLKALGNALVALRKTINDDMLKVLNIVDANGELSDQKLDQWQAQPPAWKLDVLKKLEQKVILEDSVELSEFFANISTAVIDAQKNLNAFSGAYVSELEKSNSRIPPTYFAIPNIKAEMKLGFSEMTSKGVNVILFKNEQQKKQYVESTVTFELVAAPPLPGRPQTEPVPVPLKSVMEEGVMLENVFVGDEVPVFERPSSDAIPPVVDRIWRREEREVDLSESLRLASAALFAATDRLLEAKEEVMQDQQASSVKGAKKQATAKTGKTTRKSTGTKTGKKSTAKARAGKTAKKGR